MGWEMWIGVQTKLKHCMEWHVRPHYHNGCSCVPYKIANYNAPSPCTPSNNNKSASLTGVEYYTTPAQGCSYTIEATEALPQ